MIYGGPGFLSVVGFSSSPSPSFPLPSASCLLFSVLLCVADLAYWREREGGGDVGAKPYDGEKAWSFINHSTLSDRSSINILSLRHHWRQNCRDVKISFCKHFLNILMHWTANDIKKIEIYMRVVKIPTMYVLWGLFFIIFNYLCSSWRFPPPHRK
jgi:hypothetical protein